MHETLIELIGQNLTDGLEFGCLLTTVVVIVVLLLDGLNELLAKKVCFYWQIDEIKSDCILCSDAKGNRHIKFYSDIGTDTKVFFDKQEQEKTTLKIYDLKATDFYDLDGRYDILEIHFTDSEDGYNQYKKLHMNRIEFIEKAGVES